MFDSNELTQLLNDVSKKTPTTQQVEKGYRSKFLELHGEYTGNFAKLKDEFNEKRDKLNTDETEYHTKLSELNKEYFGNLDKLNDEHNEKYDKLITDELISFIKKGMQELLVRYKNNTLINGGNKIFFIFCKLSSLWDFGYLEKLLYENSELSLFFKSLKDGCSNINILYPVNFKGLSISKSNNEYDKKTMGMKLHSICLDDDLTFKFYIGDGYDIHRNPFNIKIE